MSQDQIQLDSLALEELEGLREQLQQEVNALVQNAMVLQQTAAKFAGSGKAVEQLKTQQQGTTRMI